MFKKSLIVVAAVAAMALPAAALGDGGTPPDPGAKLAAVQAKLQDLKAKCDANPTAAPPSPPSASSPSARSPATSRIAASRSSR